MELETFTRLHNSGVEEHGDDEGEEEDDGECLEVEDGRREEVAVLNNIHCEVPVDEGAAHVGVAQEGLHLVAEAPDHGVARLWSKRERDQFTTLSAIHMHVFTV